jgi:hypothetical protein
MPATAATTVVLGGLLLLARTVNSGNSIIKRLKGLTVE